MASPSTSVADPSVQQGTPEWFNGISFLPQHSTSVSAPVNTISLDYKPLVYDRYFSVGEHDGDIIWAKIAGAKSLVTIYQGRPNGRFGMARLNGNLQTATIYPEAAQLFEANHPGSQGATSGGTKVKAKIIRWLSTRIRKGDIPCYALQEEHDVRHSSEQSQMVVRDPTYLYLWCDPEDNGEPMRIPPLDTSQVGSSVAVGEGDLDDRVSNSASSSSPSASGSDGVGEGDLEERERNSALPSNASASGTDGVGEGDSNDRVSNSASPSNASASGSDGDTLRTSYPTAASVNTAPFHPPLTGLPSPQDLPVESIGEGQGESAPGGSEASHVQGPPPANGKRRHSTTSSMSPRQRTKTSSPEPAASVDDVGPEGDDQGALQERWGRYMAWSAGYTAPPVPAIDPAEMILSQRRMRWTEERRNRVAAVIESDSARWTNARQR